MFPQWHLPSIRLISPALRLHAPLADSARFNGAEDKILHEQADQNNSQEAGEYAGYFQLVFVFINEPAEPAGAGADAEHKFRRDQGAPSERPADFKTGQYARER